MSKCLLCQINEANKKGSHIIPSFLMKRINGSGERDHEIGFAMKNGIADIYFGREIYEEQRNEFTSDHGKIECRDNYDVKDYVFCTECEKYFGSLENRYAPSLNLTLCETHPTNNTKASPTDAMLFWCSVIWRVLATEHLIKNTNPSITERLRIALVSKSLKGLNMQYELLRCKDYAIKTAQGTCATIDIIEDCVVFIIDDQVLVMYFNVNDKNTSAKLIGINPMHQSVVRNNGQIMEQITFLTLDQFSQVTQNIIVKTIETSQLFDNLRLLHLKLFGEVMPQNMLEDIVSMILKTGKLGDKFTVKHYCSCYRTVVESYGLDIKSVRDNYLISNTLRR